MSSINFPEIIPKFDSILERGLCIGVGSPSGQMCIEAAITQAMGLPFSDEPECVTEAVHQFKIRLNDSRQWVSPESRAKALRSLGIAQIGSKGIVSDVEFTKRLSEKIIRKLLPQLFREIFPANEKLLAVALRCEQEGTDSAAYSADSEKYLILVADLALEVLKELKSPGCEWLDWRAA